MDNLFELDNRLSNDGVIIGELNLSRLILVNNSLFPWLILVPRKTGLVEMIDLSPEDRVRLMEEISFISELMREMFNPDKLNIASLGNIVPQLHIHIIARYLNDAAWPKAVFGFDKKPYLGEEFQKIANNIKEYLSHRFR